MTSFKPTRAAGEARLREFVPRMGRDYAGGRNTDPGPERAPMVAMLSPWLRHRLVLEADVVRAAADAHGPASDKFVQEVFWRGYFKGWLEARPAVWMAYRRGELVARDRLATEAGLRRAYHDATEGRTGIACFDDWARELVARNWLHNHTRMWFASIWMFTLRLPWELGAAFFLRHLLDGDPASNTLSWRWVAGLHTRGKHYVARAANIERYTLGRYDPAGQLDEAPAPLTEDAPVPPARVPEPEPWVAGDVALLLHEDDCQPETLDLGPGTVRAVAALHGRPGVRDETAAPVLDFADGAVADALTRAEASFGVRGAMLAPEGIAGWARDVGLPVVTAHAPVGPTAAALAASGVPMARVRRAWDDAVWPHATRGYFQVRERIPGILRELALG